MYVTEVGLNPGCSGLTSSGEKAGCGLDRAVVLMKFPHRVAVYPFIGYIGSSPDTRVIEGYRFLININVGTPAPWRAAPAAAPARFLSKVVSCC